MRETLRAWDGRVWAPRLSPLAEIMGTVLWRARQENIHAPPIPTVKNIVTVSSIRKCIITPIHIIFIDESHILEA